MSNIWLLWIVFHSCYAGFTGDNCSQPTCTSLNNCSSHGVCIEAELCKCEQGYNGTDCSNYSCEALNFCSGMLPKMFILIFCSTSQAFAAYIEVTWYLTIKLFPAKSLWVGNNAKAMTSEAKINIAPLPANVDCSVRFTFINLYTQKIVLYEATLFSCILLTLSLSLPLLLSSLLINQEIKQSTLFLNYLYSHGCATFALWFPPSALYHWFLLFVKGEHVPIYTPSPIIVSAR